MNEKPRHETNVIVTTLFGTHYQAECKTCKWLSSRSHTNRRAAENDARRHRVEEQNK